MYEILVKNLPNGARLTCIFDCCRSGTMLDLPLSYTLKENGFEAFTASLNKG